SQLRIQFDRTRSSRIDGTVSYDVTVTNISDREILAPLTLQVERVQYFAGQPTGTVGQTGDGYWLINLGGTLSNGRLLPGQTTSAQTVTVTNPLGQHLSIGHSIFAIPAANEAPVFDSAPLTIANANAPYSYQLVA